jgi:imidazolonepropionase-like amidohydrolase
LQAATIYGARVCGIEKNTGSLEVGKRADIIVINGNPLQELGDLRNVVGVISQGAMVHHASGGKSKMENYAYGHE